MIDFAFWVKYGSWSCCPSCGSYHFNDKYFRDQVYQTQVGMSVPEHMAAHRRETPSEPIVHAEGQVAMYRNSRGEKCSLLVVWAKLEVQVRF